MSVVDLDDIDGLTPGGGSTGHAGAAIVRRLRALPMTGRISMAALAIALTLIIVAAIEPWYHADFQGPAADQETFRLPQPGMGSASVLAQCAYYAIWATALGACVAAVRSSRRVWFGVGVGAVATQTLLLLPILHDVIFLITPAADSVSVIQIRGAHAAGSYCAVAAAFVVTIALIVAVRGRILPPRRLAAALLLGAYGLVAITQRVTWLRPATARAARRAAIFALPPSFAPYGTFGAWQVGYYLLWLAVLAGGGTLLYTHRHHRPIFGATTGALAALTLTVAAALHDPKTIYLVNSSYFYVTVRTRHTAGSYLIIAALGLTACALIAAIGGRIWPRRRQARVAVVVLAAAYATGLAAALVPWARDRSGSFGNPPGGHDINLAQFTNAPQLMFYLTWTAVLVLGGALIFAPARWSRPLGGAMLGAVAAQWIVVLPVVHRPSELANEMLRQAGIHFDREPGTYLIVAALGTGALVAVLGSSSLSVPLVPGRRPRRDRLATGLLLTGMALAVAAQGLHWTRQPWTRFNPGFRGGSAYGWAMDAPTRVSIPMVLGWLMLFTAAAAAIFTAGRLRHRLVVIAAAGIAVESIATVYLFAHQALLTRAEAQNVAGIGDIVGHVRRGPGAYVVIAALVVLALSLATLVNPADLIRRPDAGTDDPSSDGSATDGTETDTGKTDGETQPAKPDHRIYMRPRPDDSSRTSVE